MAPEQWFVRRGDKESGPFEQAVIQQLAASGKLRPTDLLRKGLGGSWVQASRVRGLLTATAGAMPGPPPLPAGVGVAPPSTKTSGLATASLILGILSIFLSCLTGIPGVVCGLLGLRQIRLSEKEGDSRLAGRGLAITGVLLSLAFTAIHTVILGMLLLPAVEAASDSARRTSCSNNLKQILLGMHIYADANTRKGDNFFLTDIYDADGKPLLSWRVAILPYLEQGELYRRFRLNEPWDSPHNVQLIRHMPACLRCPSHPEGLPTGMTSYIAMKGAGLFLDPSGKARGFRDFNDGTSKSIAIVEAPPSLAIEWTRPDPPLGDLAAFLDAVSTCHGGGLFGVGFADGHVEFLRSDIRTEVFESLMTISGGEPIPDY